jgi:hypothetical protein
MVFEVEVVERDHEGVMLVRHCTAMKWRGTSDVIESGRSL